MERRLAAILIADVVGYGRLMHADEAGTLAALENRSKELIEPLVAKHGGRVVKLMGDGVLVDFGSAVGAVQCAVEIQAAMDAANGSLTENRQMVFRIGVNLGDIIVRDDDIYGDGVNVAARLEALADPGSIVLSQAVFDQVRGKVSVDFEDLGDQCLKNIPDPIHVYRIARWSAPTKITSPTQAASPKSAPVKRSIVVLPFTNMSRDPEQEYFSDGITEDIITDLSQVSALFVVARHTAFSFKAKTTEVGQLARQLKVEYVLEGSVRKVGSRIRITAQLVDGFTGGHLWAERFDRDFSDIFALQDEISKSVVAALKLKLLPDELTIITSRSTSNAQAYKFYLQARAKLAVSWGTKEYLRLARRQFVKAAKADPGYARAYAGIADCDAFLWVNGDLDVSYEQMLANSSKALELAPNLAEAHSSRGLALYIGGRPDDAMKAFERAIGLEFGLYEAHYFYGFCCRDTGDFFTAAVHFERAAELQPRNYQPLTILSEIYLVLGHRDRSAAAAQQAMSCIEKEFGPDPEVAEVLGMGAATLVNIKENARAEKWANRAVLLDPESYTVRYNAACTYAVIGKLDLAQQCLEFAFSQVPRARGWLLGIARNDTQLDQLRHRPDFQNLMQRLEGAAPVQS